MKNKNYSPVQIPNDSFKLLKDYCNENAYSMGKFLSILIKKNCKLQDKKNIMMVNNNDRK